MGTFVVSLRRHGHGEYKVREVGRLSDPGCNLMRSMCLDNGVQRTGVEIVFSILGKYVIGPWSWCTINQLSNVQILSLASQTQGNLEALWKLFSPGPVVLRKPLKTAANTLTQSMPNFSSVASTENLQLKLEHEEYFPPGVQGPRSWVRELFVSPFPALPYGR